MNREEQQALQIVRDALDTDPGQRDHFVAERCDGDTKLRVRVDAMLQRIAADRPLGADGFEEILDTLGSPSSQQPDAPQDALVGRLLGSFRVAERIGRGGMGVVYRGMRVGSDFTQEVAIKLIRRGFDFDDVHARFLRERQILARLSHPNLARFIDGGMTDDGRPWFALEFVRGQSITRWCDAKRLSLKARIRLFIDVCTAVQYAHTRLVVHRDLKPGNVLVDEMGTARLLDFGVAGLLSGNAEDDSQPSTLGGRHAMTPEYAAPEQYAGAAAGVPADVYSLGVLAYELVAGVLPYDVDRNDPSFTARHVMQAPPQPLATAIVRTGNTIAPSAAGERLDARRTGLRGYRRLVRGDLNRILDKALAKEPDRRYATVQAFSDDLSRWLQGEPVRVAGNGLGYRLGKFAQRNRIAVGLATLAILIMLAGIGGIVLKSREALREAERATAVKSFLLSLFDSNTPGGATDSVPSTRDLLKRGTERAETEMTGTPLLKAEMLTTLGRIHNQLSLHAEAEPLLRQAIRLQEASGDSKPVDRAATLRELALSLIELQQYPEAISLLEKALPLVAGIDLAAEAELRQLFGVVLSSAHESARGTSEARQAVSLWRTLEQPPAEKVGLALSEYGAALARSKKPEEALAPNREALALLRAVHGGVHSDVAAVAANLGVSLMLLGRFQEALAPLSEAIAVDRKVYGGPHRVLAAHLSNLGSAQQALGNLDEAEKAMRESVAMRYSLYGEDSAEAAKSKIVLSNVLIQREKYADSEAALRSAVAVLDKTEGDWRQQISIGEGNLAMTLVQLDRPADARVPIDRAIALQAQIDTDPFSKANLDLQSIAGYIPVREGRFDIAEAHFQKVLDQSLAHLPGNAPSLPLRYVDLANAEFHLGKFAEAKPHYEESLRLALERAGEKSTTAINARLGLAETLIQLENTRAATEQLAQLQPALDKLSANSSQRKRAFALKTELDKR